MKYLEALAISILAVLAPIKAVMITTGVMIFIDLVLGLMASRVRGEPITSAGLRRTVTKMVVYQLALVSGFICEKYLLSDFIPITKLVAGMIGVVEIKSILENSDVISGGSIFKNIINQLGSINDKEISKVKVKEEAGPKDS